MCDGLIIDGQYEYHVSAEILDWLTGVIPNINTCQWLEAFQVWAHTHPLTNQCPMKDNHGQYAK